MGETWSYPEITYSDNVTDASEISGWVTVKYPSGVIRDVKNELTFTEEGNYVVSFLAVDAAGNMSCVSMMTYAEGE